MNVKLQPNTIKKILNLFTDAVVEGIESASNAIEQATLDLREEMNSKEDIDELLPKTVYEKTEFVSLDDLRAIVLAHKPSECDGVAAILDKVKDRFHLYLTFVKGRTLLDNKENTLIIISCEIISKDIRNIFQDNKVIILK